MQHIDLKDLVVPLEWFTRQANPSASSWASGVGQTLHRLEQKNAQSNCNHLIYQLQVLVQIEWRLGHNRNGSLFITPATVCSQKDSNLRRTNIFTMYLSVVSGGMEWNGMLTRGMVSPLVSPEITFCYYSCTTVIQGWHVFTPPYRAFNYKQLLATYTCFLFQRYPHWMVWMCGQVMQKTGLCFNVHSVYVSFSEGRQFNEEE